MTSQNVQPNRDAPLTTTKWDVAQLTDAQRATWLSWLAQRAEYQSPFFRPEYVEALQRCGRPVQVLVVQEHGEPIALLPMEADGNGYCPPGGVVAECGGLIEAPHLPADHRRRLVRQLPRYQFDCAPVGTALESHAMEDDAASYIDLSSGGEAYLTSVKERTRIFRETDRKGRKLTREVGAWEFVGHTRDREALHTLMSWKSDQYNRTGVLDRFRMPWIRELVETLLEREEGDFSPRFSVLYVAGKPVAAHFGILANGVLGWWFLGYDPEYSRYSPGNLALLCLIREAGELGVRRIDLGRGDERYKRQVESGRFECQEGIVEPSQMRRQLHRAWVSARCLAERLDVLRGPLRLMRRLRNASRYRLEESPDAR